MKSISTLTAERLKTVVNEYLAQNPDDQRSFDEIFEDIKHGTSESWINGAWEALGGKGQLTLWKVEGHDSTYGWMASK